MSITDEEDDGPKLVWTFPLIRLLTRERRILNIASRVRENNGGVVERVQDRTQQIGSDSSEDDEDSELDGLEEDLEDISDNGDFVFSQADVDDVTEISVQDDVFVPTTVEIPVGGTVEWVNEDDEVHNIMSTEGLDFSSGQIEPGESFSETFDEEGVVIFIDSIRGGDVMCGAVLVGDAELDQELPCEEDVGLELFEEDSEQSSSDSVRSMEEAAEDKQRQKEQAFND